jgi:hypothetical protein
MTPVESVKWAEETLLPYYQLGDKKTPGYGRCGLTMAVQTNSQG